MPGQAPKQRLVAEVHPVVGADGEDAAVGRAAAGAASADELHEG